MEDKNKRDIIDELVDRLKSTENYPYREGAWENFRTQRLVPKKIKTWQYWSSIAALLLLCGIGYLYQKNIAVQEHTTSQKTTSIKQSQKIDPNDNSIANDDSEINDVNPIISLPKNRIASLGNGLNNTNNLRENVIVDHHINKDIILDLNLNIQRDLPNIPTVEYIKTEERLYSSSTRVNVPDQLAYNHAGVSSINQDIDDLPNKRNFRLSNKLNVGAFVSPTSNNQKLKMGGGLLFAYNVTNRLSLRTGIAFHEYEVGIMQDPTKPSSVEIVSIENVAPSSSKNLLMAEATVNSNFVAVPNVNAVTGMVQSLDIPLELSYRVTKNFYATGGLSYSPIINQSRYVKYIENVNINTFQDGVPNDQAKVESAVKVLTKTAESNQENVNPNGFGGFVNFSVGRKVNVGNKFSIAVEPFVKLPVGKFRVNEMNYTNGGIKIITSF